MYFKVLQGKAGGGGWSHSSDVSQNCARARNALQWIAVSLISLAVTHARQKFDFGSKN